MHRIINSYENSYIVIASRPGNGKTSTILENIKMDLLNNKKILFFSLESSKKSIVENNTCFNKQNLVILDNPIKKIKEIEDNMINYNPDIVYIDYFNLLPNQDEANEFFHQLSIDYNIPIIVAYNLSIENDNHDLSKITIEEFCKINGSSMINNTDNYYLYYNNDKRIWNVKKLK